jgi:adenine phosphoribosyltransferase
MTDLKSKVRIIEGFPKAGISFKDITTLLQDGPAWHEAIQSLATGWRDKQVDLVVGPEARGFLVGSALAYELGAGFVPIRKKGKLPAATIASSYQLEYGNDTVEIHADAIKPGQRVLVVDDLLATGGTIKASIDLIKRLGADIVGCAFLIELTELNGRSALADYEVQTLIQYAV